MAKLPFANSSAAVTPFSTSKLIMNIRNRVHAGLLGGLAGGAVFGILMAMMGMLTVISSMVGIENWVVGLIIHLMISVVIGIGFMLILGGFSLTSNLSAVLWGMLYSVPWWIMGNLIAMPMMSGGDLFSVDGDSLFSLMGHLIYGAVLGFVARRSSSRH